MINHIAINAKSILTEIYVSAEVAEIIKRLRPESMQEDIRQHVFLELFSMDEDFIMDLHCRGKLKHFITKMIFNTANWTGNKFKNQFGEKEIATESFEDVTEQVYEEIEIPIGRIYWYRAELLKLYAEHGTYQKVAEVTGININSIFQAVKQARKEIKKIIT